MSMVQDEADLDLFYRLAVPEGGYPDDGIPDAGILAFAEAVRRAERERLAYAYDLKAGLGYMQLAEGARTPGEDDGTLEARLDAFRNALE